jgi:hypothetical protein
MVMMPICAIMDYPWQSQVIICLWGYTIYRVVKLLLYKSFSLQKITKWRRIDPLQKNIYIFLLFKLNICNYKDFLKVYMVEKISASYL